MKTCTKCNTPKEVVEFSKNKTTADGFMHWCKSCEAAHYKNNSEKKKAYARQHRINNIEHYKGTDKAKREVNKQYYANYDRMYKYSKYYSNDIHRIKVILRSRMWSAFRSKSLKKPSDTKDMLGADWSVVKDHIETLFTDGMNWENKGKWHIDHKIPLASANNAEDLVKLCHYTNLQPLWAVDNILKGAKVTINEEVINYKYKIDKL